MPNHAEALHAALAALRQNPHRRYNPLLDEWVLVSPHRTQRPWQGQTEAAPIEERLAYDPDCYLCPGNTRAGGAVNPHYHNTFVMSNDFAALLPSSQPASVDVGGLFVARSERGSCQVVCFSPRHDLTLAEMREHDIRLVVDLWVEQTAELSDTGWIRYVQIFENRGAMMGASSPHPHCQIWANETTPEQPRRELAAQLAHQERHGSCLLCDYAEAEIAAGDRVVCENDDFVALVPFWAIWPFETLVVSRRHFGSMLDLADRERDSLGSILRRLTTRYDNVFEAPFPYSMGFHQQPFDGQHREWHFHAHFYPPLLRSATVRKFMVGYELLGNAQRDLTPEAAAERLAGLSETHYRHRA
jgi:UDPglucose--hexose-1-phosphate uridylyltransferase